jgi:hypothetical protein
VNPTELVFFGFAIAIPLVGGAALLYFVTRVSKKEEKETPKDDRK